jgi:hypothetical protein
MIEVLRQSFSSLLPEALLFELTHKYTYS